MTIQQAIKIVKKEFPDCEVRKTVIEPCKKNGIAVFCHGFTLTVMPDKTILNHDGQKLEYQK